MCQIIIKPQGKLTNIENLKRAAERNKDGFGVMYYNDTTRQMHVFKSLNFENFLKYVENNVKEYSAVIHLRFASKGKVSLDNIHPFPTASNGWLCHNGTVTGWGCDDVSDTKDIATILKDIKLDLHTEVADKLIYKIIGTSYNKFVVMLPDGLVKVYNKQLFVEEEGILYSNTNHHEVKTYKYTNNKSYSYWDDKDDYDTYSAWSKRKTYKYDSTKESPKVLTKNVKDKRVFVYGTLKKGEMNHSLLSDATFLGECTTVLKYAMVNLGQGYPYVLGRYEKGKQIKGELYLVDADTKEALDILEGCPTHYTDTITSVKMKNTGVTNTAYVYIKTSTYKNPDLIDIIYKSDEMLEE